MLAKLGKRENLVQLQQPIHQPMVLILTAFVACSVQTSLAKRILGFSYQTTALLYFQNRVVIYSGKTTSLCTAGSNTYLSTQSETLYCLMYVRKTKTTGPGPAYLVHRRKQNRDKVPQRWGCVNLQQFFATNLHFPIFKALPSPPFQWRPQICREKLQIHSQPCGKHARRQLPKVNRVHAKFPVKFHGNDRNGRNRRLSSQHCAKEIVICKSVFSARGPCAKYLQGACSHVAQNTQYLGTPHRYCRTSMNCLHKLAQHEVNRLPNRALSIGWNVDDLHCWHKFFAPSCLTHALHGTCVAPLLKYMERRASCETRHTDRWKLMAGTNLLTIKTCFLAASSLKQLFFLRLRTHSVHPLMCGQPRMLQQVACSGHSGKNIQSFIGHVALRKCWATQNISKFAARHGKPKKP